VPEPIDDYIERHKKTLEILSRPDWAEAISEGLNASEKSKGSDPFNPALILARLQKQ